MIFFTFLPLLEMNVKSAIQSPTRTLFAMLSMPGTTVLICQLRHDVFRFITTCIPHEWGRLCFHRCLSVCPSTGGGTPGHWSMDSGPWYFPGEGYLLSGPWSFPGGGVPLGLRSQVLNWRRWYPSWVLGLGTPFPRLEQDREYLPLLSPRQDKDKSTLGPFSLQDLTLYFGKIF